MKKIADMYIYRGEWIQPMFGGWSLETEMCQGLSSGIPIYKTLDDAKQRIRQYLDGSNEHYPGVIGTMGFSVDKGYFKER